MSSPLYGYCVLLINKFSRYFTVQYETTRKFRTVSDNYFPGINVVYFPRFVQFYFKLSLQFKINFPVLVKASIFCFLMSSTVWILVARARLKFFYGFLTVLVVKTICINKNVSKDMYLYFSLGLFASFVKCAKK